MANQSRVRTFLWLLKSESELPLLVVFVILDVFVEYVEGIETCLMSSHAHEHILLLRLRLLRGIEEGVEDTLQCLHFIDRAFCSCFLLLVWCFLLFMDLITQV